MKNLKSDRGIDLVSDFDVVTKYPCITVEKHNKWYSLFLVTEDHHVINIENEVNAIPSRPDIFTPEFRRIWNDYVLQGDHCWCPAHVCGVLKALNMYIGVWAYAALVMMWVEQHIEQPGFEIDYLPSFDLYQSVVTPDTEYEPEYSSAGYLLNVVRKQGDISLCNSFTEEERKQFKFYVVNPKIRDEFILREISSTNKKTEYPSFKHDVAVDEANPVLLDSHIKLSADELANIFDGSINGLTTYHGTVTGPCNDKTGDFNISEYGEIPLKYSDEAISELGKIDMDDTESAHQQADKILCDLLTKLGYTEVVEKWKGVPKWYA